jgi:hypothetical protein
MTSIPVGIPSGRPLATWAMAHALRWWKQALRLRWPAVLGLLLAVGGLALAMGVDPTLARERHELADAAQSLRWRIARAASAAREPVADVSPALRAHRYREGFPDASTRQERVAALLSAARSAGLAAKRTEFRYEEDRASGLAQYRVSLPLEGAYRPLREFAENALRADAAMSLESVRLRRSDSQQPLLQAEFVFALHMRSGLAPAPATPRPQAPAVALAESPR